MSNITDLLIGAAGGVSDCTSVAFSGSGSILWYTLFPFAREGGRQKKTENLLMPEFPNLDKSNDYGKSIHVQGNNNHA